MGRGITDVEILYSTKKHGGNPSAFRWMMLCPAESKKVLMGEFESGQKGAIGDDRSIGVDRKVRM
jgi:hypothetical protein